MLLLGNNSSVWTTTWWLQERGNLQTTIFKAKYLGITFDDKLTFGKQIYAMASSSFFVPKILWKIFPFIPQDLQKLVVIALVLSKLDYCNALYINLQQRLTNKLKVLQRAAPRRLLRIPKHHSGSQALAQLHWLPIRNTLILNHFALLLKP